MQELWLALAFFYEQLFTNHIPAPRFDAPLRTEINILSHHYK